ncbi:MAG: YncE family protein [Candidatus Eremiobacteraeota bacterium]|nr:YncE family protein [Candidatus Eremiobacteraeota bacterium]
MPLIPAMPPQTLDSKGGFDYVTVDSVNRRVYAAHGGAGSLLIVNADTGRVIGEVKIGDMAGSAVDPANGHVFTGDGDGKAISEVDPVALKELHRLSVGGPVDAIQYDAANGRIYADEDDGTRMFVVDAKTFTLIKTIKLPGHKPEYFQVDPTTHDVYQNIASDSEIAVIDPAKLAVTRTIATPELTNNHPLQLDAAHGALFAAGENGKMSVYSTSGTQLATAAFPGRVDQCDLDARHGVMACFGSGITYWSFDGVHAPRMLAQLALSHGVHTGAIDPSTGDIWTVWDDAGGAAHVASFKFSQ